MGISPERSDVDVVQAPADVACILDLLKSQSPFPILEDVFGNTQLVGIEEKTVKNASELLELIEYANSFRHTAATEKNDCSSRSHAICRITIENPAPEAKNMEDGILYLVDLAGSEPARDIAKHASDRMKETREINISLSMLKECIRGISDLDSASLAEKATKKAYIPFRQSRLTKVLKHLFDPVGRRECRTAVLACVNPSFLDAGATKNTLRYAEMLVVTKPIHRVVSYDPRAPTTWSNQDLRKYIERKVSLSLKPRMAVEKSLSNSSFCVHQSASKDKYKHPVLPSDLAPYENGTQIIQLPQKEFIARCLRTPGVTEEQAAEFYLDTWELHIESKQGGK